MSRIGIRFLIGQRELCPSNLRANFRLSRTDIALNKQETHPGWVGIICTESNVHDIIHEAIENARFVCEEVRLMIVCYWNAYRDLPHNSTTLCFAGLQWSLSVHQTSTSPMSPVTSRILSSSSSRTRCVQWWSDMGQTIKTWEVSERHTISYFFGFIILLQALRNANIPRFVWSS
jgi:hypothetical protein